MSQSRAVPALLCPKLLSVLPDPNTSLHNEASLTADLTVVSIHRNHSSSTTANCAQAVQNPALQGSALCQQPVCPPVQTEVGQPGSSAPAPAFRAEAGISAFKSVRSHGCSLKQKQSYR